MKSNIFIFLICTTYLSGIKYCIDKLFMPFYNIDRVEMSDPTFGHEVRYNFFNKNEPVKVFLPKIRSTKYSMNYMLTAKGMSYTFFFINIKI